MTTAAWIFSILLAVLLGCICHLIFGGNVFTLFIYILASGIGFVLGNWAGNFFMLPFPKIGVINIVFATLGSFLSLFIAVILSKPI